MPISSAQRAEIEAILLTVSEATAARKKRKLVDMFQLIDLPAILKCPSPAEMNREEEAQHAEVAASTTLGTKRKSIEFVDLTGDDDDMDKARGRKKPRTSPRRMPDGIRIIRNQKLRYKTNKMNHLVSGCL